MCGIAGYVDLCRDLTHDLDAAIAMRRELTHRGPDAEGLWQSQHAVLAHRRLVVVDPAGGAQPMVRRHQGRTCALVYNGELYNTPEVRRALEARGHRFTGYSDTEALLLAYLEWGSRCLDRLNGIFAFAIWDETERRLFMARDRLGVKPLFYARQGSLLVFGSELKAVLAHPAVPAEVDATGLGEIFAVGPARTPGCGVFRGVEELRAGCSLEHGPQGTRVRRYWALESRPHPDDLETTTERVRELLEDTVARQLVADVPVCTLLSGGLDSSAVTVLASASFRERGQGPLHTWSIDYEGNDENFRPNRFQPDADAPWVKRVAELAGTTHHYVTLTTGDLVRALHRSLAANDLPGMADVDSSLLLFCEQIKGEATVALSGEAADEVFGGYPWFRDQAALSADTFPWTRSTEERAALLAPEIRRQVRPVEYVRDRYHEALAEVPVLAGEDPAAARLREVSYLNITRFMPTLLDRKDRMSMAVGLEVRVPYCDHRLVEYVWNIPWELKAWNNREKGLLRRALRGLLPDDVLWRPKSPYPKTHNPAYLRAVREWFRGIIADPASPICSLLDLKQARDLARGDGSALGTAWFGQLMAGPQLFAYLSLIDEWLRKYRVRVVL